VHVEHLVSYRIARVIRTTAAIRIYSPLHFQAGIVFETSRPEFFCTFVLRYSALAFWTNHVCVRCVSFSLFRTSQETGWEERLPNDLFCVEGDVKPEVESYRTVEEAYDVL